MDGLSVLFPLPQANFYKIGNAHGWLAKSAKAPDVAYQLSGRLYMAKSGWLLLSVPNALVRGVFDAITAPGVELPLAGVMNVPNVDKELLNAHISVMTAEEVKRIGADNINERGQAFKYSLGHVQELTPGNMDGVSKLWAIQVSTTGLAALRKSYGLSATPKSEPFHITVAVRRTNVLGNNGVSKGYETSAETPDGQSFRNPISRGELKAAAAATTTYDCNCSGRCTCPPSCICKKSCCAKDKTAAHEGAPLDKFPWRQIIANAAKKTAGQLSCSGQKDLLPYGKASNVPDQDFSSKDLATGAADEREYTTDDQVAKETAKDHLHEDPAHYNKEKLTSVRKTPQIILQLRAAKEHSDNRRYDQKNHILRQLMSAAPHDWIVDDPKPYHMGVTHSPTKFRFHADPRIIPPVVPVLAKAAANPYYKQLTQTPIEYDKSKSVTQNIFGHLRRAKRQGDKQLELDSNTQSWRATLNPAYRQRLNLAIARGEMPQPDATTRLIQSHGDRVLDTLSGT